MTGSAVRVLTVPADEGFWWVRPTPTGSGSGSGEAGESPCTVREGDSVDLTGSVVAHDAGSAGQVGVDEAEGATRLTGRAAHVEALRSSVVLAG